MPEAAVAITLAPWVPERRAWAAEAQRRLAPLPVTVVQDYARRGCWDTTRRAWKLLAAQHPGRHLLVVADDMRPCDRFAERLAEVTGLRPESPLVLHSGARSLAEAVRRRGEHWAVVAGGAMGGCTVLPPALAEGFLAWLRRPEVTAAFEAGGARSARDGDDDRLRGWLTRERVDSFITLPSLLEHVGGRSSLLGHNGSLGHATAWYADDPGPVDWRAGLEHPVRAKSFRGKGELRAMELLSAADERRQG